MKTYTFSHITDLGKLSEEEAGRMIKEMPSILSALRELNSIFGDDTQKVTPVITWTDDGIDEADLKFTHKGKTISIITIKGSES